MPLAHNFSYLNHSIFHATFNARINSFYSFWSHFSCWIKPTSDLNISFIQKQNWICEYTTFILNEWRTHSNHLSCVSISGSRLKFISSFPKTHLVNSSFQQYLRLICIPWSIIKNNYFLILNSYFSVRPLPQTSPPPQS